ncbi:hypothetical protein ACSTKO_24805, partial [Vibrio parahaemolyticus]
DLLEKGRQGDACMVATSKLRGLGYVFIDAMDARGSSQGSGLIELNRGSSRIEESMRMAAALLIPFVESEIARLVKMVL